MLLSNQKRLKIQEIIRRISLDIEASGSDVCEKGEKTSEKRRKNKAVKFFFIVNL